MILALVFSLILAAIHYWNEKINISDRLWHARIISFVAGISVTYVFLSLLPEAYKSFQRLDRLIFVFIIFGFTSIHLTEKYFYKHQSRQPRLLHTLKEIHSVSFFLYYLLLGAIFVDLTSQGLAQATLFFIPILSYASVGLVSLDKIHKKIIERGPLKLALSTSTIIGVLIAPILFKTGLLFDALFAFVIGAFMYIALIDFIPRKRRGEPTFFALGVLTYTILIMALLL